ncbi:MAG: hypothetical protein KDB01_13330 [Planctomycetaceae bacterium]|nr:hypothetical protein [Planctomycetaceae bacterium]
MTVSLLKIVIQKWALMLCCGGRGVLAPHRSPNIDSSSAVREIRVKIDQRERWRRATHRDFD